MAAGTILLLDTLNCQETELSTGVSSIVFKLGGVQSSGQPWMPYPRLP